MKLKLSLNLSANSGLFPLNFRHSMGAHFFHFNFLAKNKKTNHVRTWSAFNGSVNAAVYSFAAVFAEIYRAVFFLSLNLLKKKNSKFGYGVSAVCNYLSASHVNFPLLTFKEVST